MITHRCPLPLCLKVICNLETIIFELTIIINFIMDDLLSISQWFPKYSKVYRTGKLLNRLDKFHHFFVNSSETITQKLLSMTTADTTGLIDLPASWTLGKIIYEMSGIEICNFSVTFCETTFLRLLRMFVTFEINFQHIIYCYIKIFWLKFYLLHIVVAFVNFIAFIRFQVNTS